MGKTQLIKFRESDHSYWADEQKLLGVNTFLSKFGFKFDREYYSLRKALSNNIENFWKIYFSKGYKFDISEPTKEDLIRIYEPILDQKGLCLGEEVAKILDEWELSNINGTKFHNEQEQKAYDDGVIINPFNMREFKVQPKPKLPKGYDNVTINSDLSKLEDGAYMELICFSIDHLICGQADEVFIETVDGVRYIDVGDHKTNRSKPKIKKDGDTCDIPIDHLIDCTFTKYNLQVSMYAHFLERFGFKVRSVGIYHYENYDVSTKKVITMNYLGKECNDLLMMHEDHM